MVASCYPVTTPSVTRMCRYCGYLSHPVTTQSVTRMCGDSGIRSHPVTTQSVTQKCGDSDYPFGILKNFHLSLARPGPFLFHDLSPGLAHGATRWLALVEQELLTLLEHMSLPNWFLVEFVLVDLFSVWCFVDRDSDYCFGIFKLFLNKFVCIFPLCTLVFILFPYHTGFIFSAVWYYLSNRFAGQSKCSTLGHNTNDRFVQ